MQIGKNLQLPVAVLLKVSHFLDDVTRGTVRRVSALQMRTRPLFRLRNARISSLVPCLTVGLLQDAATREVIAIDGFRVASATKRSSKKTSERLRANFRRLPEIQRRPEWRRFLDGCPHDRRFPVVIVTMRSSRTLLERRGSDTHGRLHFQILSGSTVSIDCVSVAEDISSLTSWVYTASNWCKSHTTLLTHTYTQLQLPHSASHTPHCSHKHTHSFNYHTVLVTHHTAHTRTHTHRALTITQCKSNTIHTIP